MTLTGADAHAALLEALRDIRREEDDLVLRLAHGAELVATLRAHESELFRQLAAVRLDSEARAALTAALGAQEAAMTASLSVLEAQLVPAAATVATLDKRLADLAAQRLAIQTEMGERQRELDGLARKARPALRADPAYLAARQAAMTSAATAQAAARKAEAALARHALRDAAFRGEPLFMYLFERGYLTRSYRGNALSQRFDAFVARVIDYGRARQLFQIRNDIPVRWRQHADLLAQKARSTAQALEALESVAVDAAGGRAAREALGELTDRLQALDAQTLEAEDRRDEAIKAWRELARGGEPSFAAALDALSTSLNRHDLWLLLSEARATPKGRDVVVVQQIDDARQRAKDEAAETREQRGQLKTLAARRRDLEDIAYELTRTGLDGPGVRFADDALVAGHLNAFLRAEVSASAYWDLWRVAYVPPEDAAAPLPRGGLGRPRGTARAEALTSAA